MTKGFAIRLSGEALTAFIHRHNDIPRDSFLFKVTPARYAQYCFDLLFTSKKGFEIAEGNDFPVISTKEELPE